MATYAEIVALPQDPLYQPLINKIAVAVAVKAQALAAAGTLSANQIVWAKAALQNPQSQAEQVIHYVLAANIAATTVQILNVPDTGVGSIQTAVNDAVDKLLAL